MRFPFQQQYDSMDCGPTCLAMICRYYGAHYPVHTLREKTQSNRQGVNLLGISEAAEEIGFKTLAVRLTYEQLVQNALLPGIFYWDKNHFVVVYKITRKKIFVADPAKGLLKYNKQEFCSHWISMRSDAGEEGLALLLEPTTLLKENNPVDVPGKQTFSKLFEYIRPYKNLLGQLIFGLMLSCIFQVLLPFLAQSVIDVGVSTGDMHFIYLVLLGQLALVAGRLVVDLIQGWILLHISSRINISILTDFLIKLMKLPASFFDSRNTGDIMQRMNDHQRIELFLTGSSVNLIFSLLNLLVFSVILAFFNTTIFLVFLFFSALYAGYTMVFLKKRREIDNKRFELSAKEQSASIQMIQAMQEIKVQGCEKTMRWNWEGMRAGIFRLNMKGLAINQWQQSGGFFINEGKNVLITFLSVKAVLDGQITLGAMLAIQYIIGQINSPVEQMVGFIQSLQNARISMDRLNEIHAMEDEEPVQKNLLRELPRSFSQVLVGGRRPVPGNYESNGHERNVDVYHDDLYRVEDAPAITFNNVSFTYPGAGNEPVLKDLNLKLYKGKTTAIVGTSGSGKTTLLKMLLKFYEPQRGEIKLGSMSLSNISHKVWRKHCGVVMQESFIFSDTIANNIAMGESRVDMERLYHAVHVANITSFIESLPLGFQTKIGAEGMGLSMGQKQRLLIARTVYRNPDFILLDEATNSLDAKNEAVIVANLETFFKGRTVVVVAHRLSTVKNADQIVVLNKGVIAERGTHQELVNLKGEYFTLVQNQLELGM
jgi:ATP-binding cassette, subfamily B, bacterial